MKVLFLGSASFAIETLKRISKNHEVPLVISQPPRPAGRNRKPTPTPVSDFAREHNIPLLETENVNSTEVLNKIKETEADVAIVVAFGQLLKKEVLSTVKMGFFNLHASILPKYRGAAPIQRALLDGVTQTGVTIFKIDEGMDTGDIALVEKVAVDPYETFDSLYQRLSNLGASLVEKFLSNPNIPLVPQTGEASKASKISSNETFIDWNQPAEIVANKIRAFDSTPGARAKLKGEVVKLFGVKGLSMTDRGKPGQIVSIRGHALIACGEGGVMVERIQFPSKKVITFSDAENGHKLHRGVFFDT
jgi:methionyl-tRNA formyltransferase